MENGKDENKPEGSKTVQEKGVTMLDVLHDEQELEEDANAVLGASDDQNCTYDSGYVDRQALYACTTCTQPDNPDFKAAGICLACSYHCHEGCDLVELYTKRKFCCDCPTKRFSSDHRCKLKPVKEEENELNTYGQNFAGLYCECNRPYPDPEDSTIDEMIQCLLCEDWYHGRHLGLASGLPPDQEYGEMICRQCVSKHPILLNYKNVKVPENATATENPSESQYSGETTCKLKSTNDTPGENNKSADCDNTENKQDKTEEKATSETEKTVINGDTEKSANSETEKSTMKDESGNVNGVETLFLPEGWRSMQCRCTECSEYYKKNKIEFLLDEKDTVHFYESKGKKRAGQFEQGMEALSQMDRIKQVEAISMYNNMKTDLMDYLATFAREGKVVKEEDIQKFFTQMKSAKRPRLDLPPPDSCK